MATTGAPTSHDSFASPDERRSSRAPPVDYSKQGSSDDPKDKDYSGPAKLQATVGKKPLAGSEEPAPGPAAATETKGTKKRPAEDEKPAPKKKKCGDNVRAWLAKIGLGKYGDQFVAQGYDNLTFLQTKIDLKRLESRCENFMSPGHVDKLIAEISKLRARKLSAMASFVAASDDTTNGGEVGLMKKIVTHENDAAYASALSEGGSKIDPSTASHAPSSSAPKYMVDYSKVSIDKYDEWTDGYRFDKRGDPDEQAEAFTFQKKGICGVIDPKMTPTDGTAIYIFSNHRQIGKSKMLKYLVTSGYAVFVDGVDWKADKKTVTEAMRPDPNGETLFQKRPVLVVNLRAGDKRLDKKELYDSVEEYTDGGLGLLPKGWEEGVNPLYIFVGNNPPKIGEGEPGGDLSSTRLECYEIEGIGEPYEFDAQDNPRYRDYDLVISDLMWGTAKKKGKEKFQSADYSKKAREAGVDIGVFIFFDTFVAYTPHPKRDTEMMEGKQMAQILQGKNDCFKRFLSGKGPQFETEKFHAWLRENGELLTPPGLKPVKFKLNGGSLGEMVIVHTSPSRVSHYSLKLK